jgi:hypothetical protein
MNYEPNICNNSIIDFIMMFLGTTTIIKTINLSLILSLILRIMINNYTFNWIDLLLITSVLFITFCINIKFNMVFNSVEDRFKNLKNTIDIMKERIKELKDTIFEKNKIIADLESQIKVFELNKI